MPRFCLGPVCRDITPALPGCRYCAVCRVEVTRQTWRKASRRYVSKAEKREMHRNRNRAYMAARRAA